MTQDAIKHPSHYVQAAVIIEPIDVIRHAPFDLGNAVKYICRAGNKGAELFDWQKAEQYLRWAREGYLVDPTPYDYFLKHHGLYLIKLRGLGAIRPESGFYPMLEELDKIVAKNLTRLETMA